MLAGDSGGGVVRVSHVFRVVDAIVVGEKRALEKFIIIKVLDDEILLMTLMMMMMMMWPI